MEKKFLSIVTINYNNAEGLRKTIDSIRSQSFTEYEHIIVDGGSTDGSVDVIKESLSDADYANHVSWWCSEKDSGIYNAMNNGIKHANGLYIATLNSGDTYVHDALCTLKDFAEQNPNAVLYGAISTYIGDMFCGTLCRSANSLPKAMIPHPASFVPRVLYEKYGLYDESFKTSGDWELFLRLYKGGEKFVYLDRIIAHFYLGGISSTQKLLVSKENRRLLMRYGYYNVTYKQRIISLLKKILNFLPGRGKNDF